jgi:hypothetical protein
MIRSQLKTLLWLRWRLVMNHSRRYGVVSLVLLVIFRIIFAVLAFIALITGFLVGATYLPGQPGENTMLIWGGATVFYLVFTLLGIMIELQRSDIMSLSRLLHLPVTLSGAFLINYIGSSLNWSVLVFFPGMAGLALGMLAEMGGGTVLLLPLVLAFFLLITALVYQFRGWLASMMTNPRRRQTMIVILTMAFILMSFLPALPGMIQMRRASPGADTGAPSATAKADTGREDRQPGARRQPMAPEEVFKLQSSVRFAAAVLPPGWVAYGTVHVLEGRIAPALACLVGMVLIGAWSLRRSYRTTLRLYQGDFVAAHGRGQVSTPELPERGRPDVLARRRTSTAMRLPGIPERACAVGAAGFRALLRMPEMKLTLLSPLFMLLFYGGMFGSRNAEISEYLAALRALVVAAFMLIISIMYMLTNQFAYDRAGFRALVLSPVPRREVLLGKNLAFFPFAAGLMILAISLSQWLAPMHSVHLVAVSVQIMPIYLWFCMVGNTMSIYLPLVVKSGTAMPATGQGLKLLLRFLATMLSLVPLGLVAVPLGIEYLMQLMNWGNGFPAFLVLAILQTALVIWLYTALLDRQAEWLSRREQRILEVVTTKPD